MGSAGMPAPPNPTDYSPAMINASNNQLTAQLSQTATQQLLGQLMASNQAMQIMTNGQVALEGIDAKLQIAKMQFNLAEEAIDKEFEQVEMNHEEKMEELRVREHESELAANRPLISEQSTGEFRS